MEEKKDYQRNLQQLQVQLEIAWEHRNSLDPISVKKRLEDYEQMLQFYTLMKTKWRIMRPNLKNGGRLQRNIL